MNKLLSTAVEDGNRDKEPTPVMLYCRAGKNLQFVFCGELGEVEVLETEKEHTVLVWTLMDFDELSESEHFNNLVRFANVRI
jgi:hypothetical protein